MKLPIELMSNHTIVYHILWPYDARHDPCLVVLSPNLDNLHYTCSRDAGSNLLLTYDAVASQINKCLCVLHLV